MQHRNEAPEDDFDGLSSEQMHRFLHFPFESLTRIYVVEQSIHAVLFAHTGSLAGGRTARGGLYHPFSFVRCPAKEKREAQWRGYLVTAWQMAAIQAFRLNSDPVRSHFFT